QATGRAIGQEVLAKFSVSDDVLPPTIVFTSPSPGRSFSTNPTISGWALDNLSGVAAIEAAVDGGAYTTVNIVGPGRFSFQPALAVSGRADGSHFVHFRATDYARLKSA